MLPLAISAVIDCCIHLQIWHNTLFLKPIWSQDVDSVYHCLTCLCWSFKMTEMHPYMWSKEDVYMWLDWCRKEYALSDVPLEKFSMNGKYSVCTSDILVYYWKPNRQFLLIGNIRHSRCFIEQNKAAYCLPTRVFGVFSSGEWRILDNRNRRCTSPLYLPQKYLP